MECVFVLLPVHNRREVTRRFVECLAQQDHPGITLVLLDDGSVDGTAEMVRERIPSAVVLRGDGTWWWAGALQRGYAWLRTAPAAPDDVVCIMNDDTEFAPDFVRKGVDLVRAHPRALVAARAFDRDSGRLLDPGRHVDWRRLTFSPAKSPAEVNCASTRGLFMTVSDFREIGGFRPALLPHYGSDYEFTVRAHRRGWALVTDPDLSLRLDHDATGFHELSGTSFGAFLRRYFSNRSALNPIRWTAFVALSCPWPWKLLHIAGIWKKAAGAIIAAARRTSSRG